MDFVYVEGKLERCLLFTPIYLHFQRSFSVERLVVLYIGVAQITEGLTADVVKCLFDIHYNSLNFVLTLEITRGKTPGDKMVTTIPYSPSNR